MENLIPSKYALLLLFLPRMIDDNNSDIMGIIILIRFIFIFVKKVKVREKNHLNRKDQSDLL